MSKDYLDKTGLTHLWSIIKSKIPTKTSDLTNDNNFNYSTNVTKGTIDTLAAFTSGKPGMTGSIELTKKDSGVGSDIPAGWYNYFFAPHRHGIGGDNPSYGTIILTPMNFGGKSWILRRAGNTTTISEVKEILTSHQDISGYVKNSNQYLNIHPENSPVLIPFINNDIAFLTKRGGSYVVEYNGVVKNLDISNVFDGSPSYWAINPTDITTITIELTLHTTFAWSNTIYIDFGNAQWRAKSIKIETINSTYESDVWVQRYNTTTNGSGNISVNTSHTPVGASNAGGGFNKVRFTFSNWGNATIFRIAQLGIYNYGSSGVRQTSMSRGIDDPIFRDITPNETSKYSLGTATKKWKNIYADNFVGTITKASQDSDGNQINTTYAKVSSLKTVATSGSYNDLSNKPSIPAKTSQLVNDSFFASAITINNIGHASSTGNIDLGNGFAMTEDIPTDTINGLSADNGILTYTRTDGTSGTVEVGSSGERAYASTPIGGGMDYYGITPPPGFLFADGSAVSRTEYSELFAVIGTTYGVGDGSTTFNLPDKRTRVSVGLLQTDDTFNTLGKAGGEKTHIITTAEMPSHGHTGLQVSNPKDNNGNTYRYLGTEKLNAGVWAGNTDNVSAGVYQYNSFNGFTGNFTASNSKTGNTGNGGAHNNLQPYLVCNYIIRAKNIATTSTMTIQDVNMILELARQYAASNINLYSTNEVAIGTWVDGKTIYRRVVKIRDSVAATTSYSYALTYMGYSQMIHARLFYKVFGNATAYIDGVFYNPTSSSSKPNFFYISAYNLSYRTEYEGTDLYGIFEYTK